MKTPIVAVDSRTVEADLSALWSVIADIQGIPRWWPKSMLLKILYLSSNGIGSQLEIRPMGGKAFQCRVASMDPPHRMKMVYDGPFIQGEGCWVLEKAGKGTKVSYHLDVMAAGWTAYALSKMISLSAIHSRLMMQVFNHLEKELALRNVVKI